MPLDAITQIPLDDDPIKQDELESVGYDGPIKQGELESVGYAH